MRVRNPLGQIPGALFFPLFIVTLLIVTSCGPKNPFGGGRQGGSTETHPVIATNSNTTASTTTPAGEKIGVPECDDFIAQYEACLSAHVPAAQRTQYKENIEGYRRAWRQQIAANPDVKASLPAACKRHLEQARITMKQFGCEF